MNTAINDDDESIYPHIPSINRIVHGFPYEQIQIVDTSDLFSV
jgi:hypothetical protein